MKENEQRIALAEWMGWKECLMTIRGSGAPERRPSPYGVPPKKKYVASLPDYPHDLNAIAVAESKLDKEKLHFTYSHNLYNVVVPKEIQPFRASAAHRSEALLRTLGLYKE